MSDDIDQPMRTASYFLIVKDSKVIVPEKTYEIYYKGHPLDNISLYPSVVLVLL